jgi:Uma2 family endonuclease
MHMASASARWTAEMVRALPEDRNRYEVIDGELIVSPGPSWRHQHTVQRLVIRLTEYLDRTRIGHLVTGPGDIEFARDTLVEPDLFVVPLIDGDIPLRWEDVRSLVLVIEVLSPSSGRRDRLRKRKLYLREGAQEYWIVDTDSRLVERWIQGRTMPEIIDDTLEWLPANASEPFVMNLQDYFADILKGKDPTRHE